MSLQILQKTPMKFKLMCASLHLLGGVLDMLVAVGMLRSEVV